MEVKEHSRWPDAEKIDPDTSHWKVDIIDYVESDENSVFDGVSGDILFKKNGCLYHSSCILDDGMKRMNLFEKVLVYGNSIISDKSGVINIFGKSTIGPNVHIIGPVDIEGQITIQDATVDGSLISRAKIFNIPYDALSLKTKPYTYNPKLPENYSIKIVGEGIIAFNLEGDVMEDCLLNVESYTVPGNPTLLLDCSEQTIECMEEAWMKTADYYMAEKKYKIAYQYYMISSSPEKSLGCLGKEDGK